MFSRNTLAILGALTMFASAEAAVAQDTSTQGKHYDAEAERWISDDPTAPANVDPLPMPKSSSTTWNNQDDNESSEGRIMGGIR